MLSIEKAARHVSKAAPVHGQCLERFQPPRGLQVRPPWLMRCAAELATCKGSSKHPDVLRFVPCRLSVRAARMTTR